MVAKPYGHDRHSFRPGLRAQLPSNPLDDSPLLLAPLNMLRHVPWINDADGYPSFVAPR